MHRTIARTIPAPLGAFRQLESNLHDRIARIRAHPWTKDVPVHGGVCEVDTGRLREVV